MTALTGYVEKWKLENPLPLATTATSTLYRVNQGEQQLVLKLFTPVGMEDERSSATALRCFAGKSAVRLFANDDNAQLLEYAGGEPLKSLVASGDDAKATIIICRVLNDLHSAYVGQMPEALTPLNTRFRSLFRKSESDKNGIGASIYTKAAGVAEKLLSTQKDACVLHGDMHHENIIHSEDRGWLSIDPKGLYGERTFDAANTLCNPIGMERLVFDPARFASTSKLLAQNMNLDVRRLLAFTFAYACLSACWSLEDGQEPNLSLKVAAMAEQQLQTS